MEKTGLLDLGLPEEQWEAAPALSSKGCTEPSPWSSCCKGQEPHYSLKGES